MVSVDCSMGLFNSSMVLFDCSNGVISSNIAYGIEYMQYLPIRWMLRGPMANRFRKTSENHAFVGKAMRYLGGGVPDPGHHDEIYPYRCSPQFSMMFWNLGNWCRKSFDKCPLPERL